MKFDRPALQNPIDQCKVIGQPVDRVDGPLKTTGRATYAYEHQLPEPPAYGYLLGAAIPKGRIVAMELDRARAAPGVLGIVNWENAGVLGRGDFYVSRALAGPAVDHYHQAVAIVIAQTFEQARAAAALIRVHYERQAGHFDLATMQHTAATPPPSPFGAPPQTALGDFDQASAQAPVTLDQVYTTPDHAHAMLEPHATIAQWQGDQLTLWTSIQQLNWGVRDLAKTLGIPKACIHLIAPYIGGGFGGKGTILTDAVMASLAARQVGRPVKLAIQRPLMFNNLTHRPATIQRIRLGAGKDGRLTAIGHQSCSGNLEGGRTEPATTSTLLLYAGANRMTDVRLARLDLAEGNAMRAPGEAAGMMALEIAMDELAHKLGLDPVELRIRNDTQVDPADPARPFSRRQLVACFELGRTRFGWDQRPTVPASRRQGPWLVGYGTASAIRGAPTARSAARVRLAPDGRITVETDMTDIGTGSYTIIAQTAAEMMGVPMAQVSVRLGDSCFPESPGSGGQWGAASSTAGVYAACMQLRQRILEKLGVEHTDATFSDGHVVTGNRTYRIADAAADGELVAEDFIEFADLAKRYAQQTFGAHFVEVHVHAATGEIRIQRMLG